jgi:hypothetical protein
MMSDVLGTLYIFDAKVGDGSCPIFISKLQAERSLLWIHRFRTSATFIFEGLN